MNNTSACLITGILLSSLIFVGEGRSRTSGCKMKLRNEQGTVSVKKGSGQTCIVKVSMPRSLTQCPSSTFRARKDSADGLVVIGGGSAVFATQYAG